MEQYVSLDVDLKQLPSAHRAIVEDLVPEVIKLFAEKGRDYGETFAELGIRGQFADIWRKLGKLKRALWDGAELHGEQPEEILMDFIGHALLTIYLIRVQRTEWEDAHMGRRGN